ncbi:MAG: hypothetical protein ACREQ9_27315, partial [Candidatus Binatia bacterium]
MAPDPAEITLEIRPQARLDLIDVARRIRDTCGDLLTAYPKALYCSYHTTAGYLDQSLAARLQHSPDRVGSFIGVFRRLFPAGADYFHDQIDLRSELSEEQRRIEPRNADSHLAYMSAGLRSCVVYRNRPDTPVYFVDLDGVHDGEFRRRQTTVVGFTREERVRRVRLEIPMSAHPVDSVNLKDPRIGFFDRISELLARDGIVRGRVDIALDPSERHAGLTVNEYETLLMKHDLAEVLRDPLRFMMEKGRHMWQDPRAIPSKTRNYAKYDLVQVVNELLDVLGASESLVEKLLARLIAVPASRFLAMKRSVSLLVADREGSGKGSIVAGLYQSPILVQWDGAPARVRTLDVSLTRI